MPAPIPVAIPVAAVVDTASDSWKHGTFRTTLLPIAKFIVMAAIWKELKDLRLLLSEGKESIHERAKSCDSNIQAALAEVRDPSPHDNEELHGENGSLKDLSEDKFQESIGEERQDDEVPLSSTSTIGFDNVSTTTRRDHIPNGYHGLEWEHVFVMHRSWYPGSGLQHGVVSGNYGAYNGYGGPVTIASATPFSVAGFQFTAAWKKDMNVLVEGFGDGGNRIAGYQTTLGDPRDGPTFIDLRREGNFEGLRKLKVTPSGGTDAGLDYDIPGLVLADIPGLGLAIDDLTVY